METQTIDDEGVPTTGGPGRLGLSACYDVVSVRSKVFAEIADVARRNRRPLVSFDESSPIFRIGLDSLCFVDLVLRLQDEYGSNPFESLNRDAWPVTVGGLIAVYVGLDASCRP